MNHNKIKIIRELFQRDINKRGLQTDRTRNLITETMDDFQLACTNLANARQPCVGIVTGFYIPTALPPAAETDGPIGALFLARALATFGVPTMLASERYCLDALRAGIEMCGLNAKVTLKELPQSVANREAFVEDFYASAPQPLTHLIAIERAGPSHTLDSLQAQAGKQPLGETYLEFLTDVPSEHQNRCHSMSGNDITNFTCPAECLFDSAAKRTPRVTTIGIGDGGNEIGMGKIPWGVIRRNITNGGLIACRVPTDFLIVAGVSNWGAYGLAAGIGVMRKTKYPPALFDVANEGRILRHMVQKGPLVDGVVGKQQSTVDGLALDKYGDMLHRIEDVCYGW